MPTAKKKTTKRTTTGETTRLKNTIALLQRDLADALNREKVAKDQARAVTEDRAAILTRLQETNSAWDATEGQRQALAEKYIATTLDAHEIAKYAVAAYDQALLAESALTAAGEYIERLRADMNATTLMLHATVDAMAKVLKVSREVVYALIDHGCVLEEEGTRERRRYTNFERKDRFEKGKAKMADIGQKVRDYATMPVDKVKMRLDAGLPVAAKYQWKGGTSFYGENPPPATVVAMASMTEETKP